MARESSARFLVLAIGGTLALNYPLLALFDRDASVFGLPLPFVHLFVVWMLLIGALAWLAEGRAGRAAGNGIDDDRRAHDGVHDGAQVLSRDEVRDEAHERAASKRQPRADD